MASLPPQDEYRTLVKRINSSNYLLNKQLQHICSVNGLRSGGVKAELQRRLIDALNNAYSTGDAETFSEIEQSVYREKQGLPSQPPRGYAAAARPPAHSSGLHGSANHAQPSNMAPYGAYQQQPTNGHHGFGGAYGGANGQRAQPVPAQGMSYFDMSPIPAQQFGQQLIQLQGPAFRPSPFYLMLERLGDVHICEAMASHRNSITISIQAQDHPILQQCVNDKSLRVMVFCAAANYGVQDIAFPHQSELKVNADDVKANLRGLKNKPGSTRPVDITDLLRLRPASYNNAVEFTYALTQKAGAKASSSQRFYLVIQICRSVPVENLVRNITTRKISKESVIKELTSQAHDADIELSSQVLSLKCPLSYMRLVTPIRATTCTHVQCFDATSYLQLQQQGPQWVCPVCSKPAPYDRLAIDEYVRDILVNTSKSADQVNIEPNGQWKTHGPIEDVKPEPQYDALELDDDDIDISEFNMAANRGPNTPNGLAPTPGVPTPATGASREGSLMSRPGGTKRTHEVIDLTLSDDDDDEPPNKRPHFHRPGSGLPSYF